MNHLDTRAYRLVGTLEDLRRLTATCRSHCLNAYPPEEAETIFRQLTLGEAIRIYLGSKP